jgi:hypothetical protein
MADEASAPTATGVVYRRSAEVDEETFEDELLLLHRSNRAVLALNQAAASLWQALRWPQSADDLIQLLLAAWPNQSVEWARTEVTAALAPLVDHQFIERVDP